MKKTDLKKIREAMKIANKRWVDSGKKLTSYVCPHCLEAIATAQPELDDVSNKGYWDSTKVCVHCEGVSFVTVWPNGHVYVEKF